MKFNKSNFDLLSIAGGMVGGIAAKFVEKFTVKEDSENNYLTVAVQAAAGAAISAFAKNSLLKSAGAGMVGVAGYSLAKELQIGESDDTTDTTTTPATSGIGLLPSQLAISGSRKIGNVEKEKEPVRTNML